MICNNSTLIHLYHISSLLREKYKNEGKPFSFLFALEINSEVEIPFVDKLLGLKERSSINIRVMITLINFIDAKTTRRLFEDAIPNSQNFELEFAESQGELWYLLHDNVNNGDQIHIFSSERRKEPKAVENYRYNNEMKKI